MLINARAAARPELGGVERWAREVAARLHALAAGTGGAVAYEVMRPRPRLVHRAGHAWEQLALPALATGRRAALLLSPANVAPVVYPRNVVVVHDAAALRDPTWYSPAYVAWQRALLPALASRAVHLVTVSQFSRDELVDLAGADPARITVIPGGVDERFSPQTAPAERPRPYVLTVASRTARKNLGALDASARRLRREGIDLVAVGGDRPQFRDETSTGTAAEAITWLGHVDDTDLPGLYAGASAFVLPSLYEGFGLTALEAMASGTPVVASDRGALPHVVGDAALLVDPEDPEGIADAVMRAIGDERLRTAGPRRAAAFTWRATTERLDALIRRLLDERG